MDPTVLLQALATHQYVIAIALVTGALVAAAKQGWLSAKVASVMPAWALPYYAVVLGVVGSVATQVQQGVTFKQAVFNGVLAGMAAVFGHETIIESARGGREVIPARASADPPPVA